MMTAALKSSDITISALSMGEIKQNKYIFKKILFIQVT